MTSDIKNILLTTIILLFIMCCWCQNKQEIMVQNATKPIYIDSSNNEVYLRWYKNENNHMLVKEIKTDSSVIKEVLRHKKIENLDYTEHQQIRDILTTITGSKFDESKNTMIHLYSMNDSNLKDAVNNKKYWKWIKKNSDHFQAFLIGTTKSQIQPNRYKNVYLDEHDFFKNTFFTDSSFHINHLFIKPDGEIYIYYGLNDILAALDWSV